jgi:hypothetical protein
VLGERHDITVRCMSEVELLAVPREDLQKSLTHESYLSSVWKAPAQKRMQLRRQISMALPGAKREDPLDTPLGSSGDTNSHAAAKVRVHATRNATQDDASVPARLAAPLDVCVDPPCAALRAGV